MCFPYTIPYESHIPWQNLNHGGSIAIENFGCLYPATLLLQKFHCYKPVSETNLQVIFILTRH